MMVLSTTYRWVTPNLNATSTLRCCFVIFFTERKGWHLRFKLCSVVTLPHAKRCFKRPSASCLKRIAARSQRGTSTPFSPLSGASFFVGPSSKAERDASSATCFSDYVKCHLPACAAPSSERLRRGILGGLYQRYGTGLWVGGHCLAIIAGYTGKSPARRDKRDILYNVLVSRAVYFLPVHGLGKKEHNLGLKPYSSWPKPCSLIGPVHGSRAVCFFFVGIHA
jgi:hypothetical protein